MEGSDCGHRALSFSPFSISTTVKVVSISAQSFPENQGLACVSIAKAGSAVESFYTTQLSVPERDSWQVPKDVLCFGDS